MVSEGGLIMLIMICVIAIVLLGITIYIGECVLTDLKDLKINQEQILSNQQQLGYQISKDENTVTRL